jgi:hypothetical protein
MAENARRRQPSGSLTSSELQRGRMRETSVPIVPQAPTPPQERRLGPRRIIPPVPEGPDVPDDTPSPPASIIPRERQDARLARGATEADQDLMLVRNVTLGSAAANNSASSTGEPSVAMRGDVVFMTGNWYAALSSDGGNTFQFVDPFTAFPDPPGMGFCCDQIVHYIPQIDTFVWLLQYTENRDNENIQRLAFATTNDVVRGRWRTYDITPRSLDLPNILLDFPDLAVGDRYLYVTTNGFRQNGTWASTVLLRIDINSVDEGDINAQQTKSSENFNFRVAQHCGTRVFWASHNNTSSIRVFEWDEDAAQPTFRDVRVARWSARHPESITPEGFNWLNRSDPRILGATLATNGGGSPELWFSWNSASGGVNGRPNPYVQIARISADDFAVREHINLWDANFAIAYAALVSNADGEVGVSYAFGGRRTFPSHAVGILTDPSTHVSTAEGAHGPSEQRWGDYFTIRRHYPDMKLFAATGYTLQSGTGRTAGSPQFALFGRASDVVRTASPTLENLAARLAALEDRVAALAAQSGGERLAQRASEREATC